MGRCGMWVESGDGRGDAFLVRIRAANDCGMEDWIVGDRFALSS
jgi:hypothetical protein